MGPASLPSSADVTVWRGILELCICEPVERILCLSLSLSLFISLSVICIWSVSCLRRCAAASLGSEKLLGLWSAWPIASPPLWRAINPAKLFFRGSIDKPPASPTWSWLLRADSERCASRSRLRADVDERCASMFGPLAGLPCSRNQSGALAAALAVLAAASDDDADVTLDLDAAAVAPTAFRGVDVILFVFLSRSAAALAIAAARPASAKNDFPPADASDALSDERASFERLGARSSSLFSSACPRVSRRDGTRTIADGKQTSVDETTEVWGDARVLSSVVVRKYPRRGGADATRAHAETIRGATRRLRVRMPPAAPPLKFRLHSLLSFSL